MGKILPPAQIFFVSRNFFVDIKSALGNNPALFFR